MTLSGVAPDVDGLGIIAELATVNTKAPLYWWKTYHHVLCHNLCFGLILVLVVAFLSMRRWVTALLALLAFHLHLLCDLVGSQGPDGYQWPIPYLLPFSDRCQLAWDGQWAFNAPPNILFTALVLMAALYLAWKRGCSPLEMVSRRADAVLVSTLRKRFSRA